MRSILFALALVCGGTSFAQDLSAKVSLSVRGSRVPLVLSELSKASKLKFESSMPTQGDVLALNVNDVPLGDLMKRIATVTAGEWKPIDGGFRLVADAGARRIQQRTEDQKRIDGLNSDIKKRLDAMRKQDAERANPKPKTGKPDEEKFDFNDMPIDDGGRAILKLVVGLDRTLIANVQKGDRIVFSTTPTRMQRPLPSNALSIINDYVVQHNANVKGTTQPPDSEMEKLPKVFQDMANRGNKRILDASKALLIFSRQSLMDVLNCELRIYDSKGATLASETLMLGNGTFMAEAMDMAAEMDPGKAKQKQPEDKSAPVVYSEDSLALAKLDLGTMQTGSLKIDPSTLDKIYRPDTFDPLSFSTTDELFSAAKANKLQLVANMPDSSLSLFGSMTKKATTVGTVLAAIDKTGPMMRLVDDGWLTVLPREPASARDHRIDRVALKTIMGIAKAKGSVGLDDMADYSLKAEDPMTDTGLGMMYFTMFVPGGVSQGIIGTTNWDVLRFYGSLPISMRQQLRKGVRLSFANFSNEQLGLVNRLVFGANGRIEVQRPGEKSDPMDMMTKMMMSFGGGGGGRDYLDEPTEAIPNGITADGVLVVKSTNEPVCSIVPQEGTLAMGAMSNLGPDEMAMLKMFSDNPQASAYMPMFNRLVLSDRDHLDFTFHFSNIISLSEPLNDNHPPTSKQIYSLSSLPTSVSQVIDAKMAALKNSPFGSAIGAMGTFGKGIIKP